jgi:isopentenyl-diphosphate delta-isomerase
LSAHSILDVILVDQQNNSVGAMEKLEAHQKGILHRAFSVFVFNEKKELLMQRRAMGKYHSEGLWSNTCCSHPFPGETNLEAAHRRLGEEMGFDCFLEEEFHFIYHENLDNNLIEHELDAVIIGFSEESPNLNTSEVSEFKWLKLEAIKTDMLVYPEKYTIWFKLILQNHLEKLHIKLHHESLQKRNI